MKITTPRAGRLAIAAAFALGATITVAHAEPKILAKIDGAPITQDDVDDAMADIGPGLPEKLEGAERQKYVLDYLIDLRLVAKKAVDDKLDAGPEFDRKLAYYRDKLEMESLLTGVAKGATTEENERKAYDAAAKAQPPEPEIHARHILLPDEASAKAALARVRAGEDFAKVATELSKDPGGEGGDLGWFTKDRMVPEFAEAAFKLEPGQISEPVKSQFGWHIIKVEEKRIKSFPPFEQVKDQAARYVAQKAQTELIASLRGQVKIERFDEAPKPAAAAAGAPAASETPAASSEAPADPAKPKTP
jgi:peptidyl-prolyl cis-trans isomerase C